MSFASPTDYQLLVSALARSAKGKTVEHRSEPAKGFSKTLTYGEATVYVSNDSYDAESFSKIVEKSDRRHKLGKLKKADVVKALAAIDAKSIFDKAASGKAFEAQVFAANYAIAQNEKTYAAYAQLADAADPLMTKAAHKKAFPLSYQFSGDDAG